MALKLAYNFTTYGKFTVTGQNGMDKMVWTEWYRDKMVRTKWYNFISYVHFNIVEFNICFVTQSHK